MPRSSRQNSPTGIYHVMLRGIDRNTIFADDQDCRKFVKILRQLINPKDKDNNPLPPYCNIHAYCLMTNHIHLLIAEGTEPIGQTMKRIGISYVSYYNKRHNRLGPLFHDRFRSEPVGDAGYFVTLLRYIHRNPVEAEMVDSPDQYQWSSWHEYSGSIKADGVCARKLPFSRMTWNKVCELAMAVSNMPSPKPRIERRRLTDAEATEIIARISNGEPVKEMQGEQRKSIITAIIKAGVGMRQLARLSKIDYKTIAITCRLTNNKEKAPSKEPSL
ncbi:transposase [Sodaliphilus sp.]|uniref:transposase n=1 Tax=Sodaliphilus sp. TaxID=2815818 RepID=UPI00388EC497